MLIQIDAAGYQLLQQINYQVKETEPRWYYAGNHNRAPIVVVARGQQMAIGQIWDANSGNETGYPGFCRPAHVDRKIGKLTLRREIPADTLAEDAQVLDLSYQINWILTHLNR